MCSNCKNDSLCSVHGLPFFVSPSSLSVASVCVCVCVCVSMCVCVYTCMCVCVRVCACELDGCRGSYIIILLAVLCVIFVCLLIFKKNPSVCVVLSLPVLSSSSLILNICDRSSESFNNVDPATLKFFFDSFTDSVLPFLSFAGSDHWHTKPRGGETVLFPLQFDSSIAEEGMVSPLNHFFLPFCMDLVGVAV